MSQFVHITGAGTMETILSGRVAEPKNRFLSSRADGLVFLATLKWFSRSWYARVFSCRVCGRKTAHTFPANTYGGQIGHNPLVIQLAAICQPVRREDKQNPQGERLNRDTNPLFALLRANFCQLKRHIAPVYESGP